jgi:chromosome segregation ATPase
VARLIQDLRSQVEENGSLREAFNDLENRLIIVEERTSRSAENQNLRTLVLLLNRWPGGTCGLIVSLVALNAAISLCVEAIGAATVLRSLLGL